MIGTPPHSPLLSALVPLAQEREISVNFGQSVVFGDTGTPAFAKKKFTAGVSSGFFPDVFFLSLSFSMIHSTSSGSD